MTSHQEPLELEELASKIEAQGASAKDAPFVFWDGLGLGNPASGVAVHAASLARALASQSVTPIVIGDRTITSSLPQVRVLQESQAGRLLARVKVVAPQLRAAWAMRALTRLGLAKRVAYHGLSNVNLPVAPRLLPGFEEKCAAILTVHDLIPLLAPESVSKSYYTQMRLALPRALKTARRVICVSRWTLDTLIARFPEVEGKALWIPNGVERSSRGAREPLTSEAVRLIAVGRFETYKRQSFLLEILKLRSDFELTLVTDERGKLYFEEKAPDLVRQGRVRILMRVDHDALKKLYAEAHVLVHPSLFEGFCLPAAEALAAGIPVVYTAGSGIDEVCGADVATPLPKDASPREWTDAIERAATPTADFSARLARHLASLATWDDVGAQTAKLYRDCIEIE